MTESRIVYLTPEGMEDLKKEIQFLKTKERARVAQAIADARAQGDLSENAEYDAAKEEQGLLEARIAKAEQTIANARVIDETTVDTSKAFILSKVTVKNKKSGVEQVFTLVSEREADLREKKISVGSPIGAGLLGKDVGDIVKIDVPAGAIELEILNITR